MSSPIATRSPGLPDDYYAPEFSITVDGKKLDPDSRSDVLEIKVVLETEKVSSVDIKLNNFDDSTFDLKWSDSELFKLGNPVHVRLGYADRLLSMFQGPITALSPEFPSNAAPTLTVRAMDPLVRLKSSKPPESGVVHENKADWEIAQKIAQRHKLRIKVDRDGPVHESLVQSNDDLSFLTQRAARIDFRLFTRTDPDTGEVTVHFIKPRDGREAGQLRTYQLAWGSLATGTVAPSLIEFKPTISVDDQVQSVTVRGWDVERKKAISHTAKAGNTPGVSGSDKATGPSAAKLLAGDEGKKAIVVNAPVASKQEAQRLAEHLLAEYAYDFLSGSGKTIGLPDLRAGDNVEISGVGARFTGTYYVTRTTHVLNANGYTTEFDVGKTYQGNSK